MEKERSKEKGERHAGGGGGHDKIGHPRASTPTVHQLFLLPLSGGILCRKKITPETNGKKGSTRGGKNGRRKIAGGNSGGFCKGKLLLPFCLS